MRTRIDCSIFITFQVILAAQLDSDVNDFRREVARRMLLPPWIEYTRNIDVSWPFIIVQYLESHMLKVYINSVILRQLKKILWQDFFYISELSLCKLWIHLLCQNGSLICRICPLIGWPSAFARLLICHRNSMRNCLYITINLTPGLIQYKDAILPV